MHLCNNSHCTIIAANHSRGPFHHVKAVSVVEHCAAAEESLVNPLLPPHHCPQLTAAGKRSFLILALLQRSLQGLVYGILLGVRAHNVMCEIYNS